MFVKTEKELYCDDVAEVIEEIPTDCKILFDGYAYEIPRDVKASGPECVLAWRAGVLHGITGTMDRRSARTGEIRSVKLWDVVQKLAHEQFTICSEYSTKGANMITGPASLAAFLGTTVDGIRDHIRMFTDYETIASLNDNGLLLRAVAGDTGKYKYGHLYFPFSDEVYEDMLSGLQCWADATYWESQSGEEV